MEPTMNDSQELSQKKCAPCEGGTRPFSPKEVETYLLKLPGWKLGNPSTGSTGSPQAGSGQAGEIEKNFTFKNYYETMAFVNAVAFIANREDHHPDMEVGYKTCKVKYSTHAIKGLSENDFICAAKIEELLK
jgi:4a-hydroxytetrahydrobiopterin dehydratase